MIAAIIDMKSQSYLGCPRIAQQAALVFRHRDREQYGPSHPNIHYRPEPDAGGPSWLAFLGHTKTVCRESIRFEASPLLYERVGIGSSWTNRRAWLMSRRHDSRPPQ